MSLDPELEEQRKAALQAADRSREQEDAEAAERRRPIYTDVEALLSPGFLSHSMAVSGVSLAMRSLSPGDAFLLRHRVGTKHTDREWRDWVLASSIWMVDGQPLLEDPHATHRVYRSIRALPRRVSDILFSVFTGLFNRVTLSMGRVEAFCYESFSRFMWRSAGRLPAHRDEYTGVPGSAKLGFSHVQRMWLAFNLAEDDHERWLEQWAAAKLVASSMSPKGVKKISQYDDALREREQDRRRRVIEQVWMTAVGKAAVLDARPQMVVYRASTADELVDEMRRWVAGEKDEHDIIVDAWKNRVRDGFRQQREEREDRARAIAHAQDAMESAGIEHRGLVGYTVDQLHNIVKDRPAGSGGIKTVYENDHPSLLYHRYLEHDPSPGALSAGDSGLVIDDGKRPRSLKDDVANRSVKLTSGDREG